MKKGYVYCQHFDHCHELHVCLCEIAPYDDGTTSPLPHDQGPKKTPWPIRREQILQFAKENDAITTTMIMKLTSGARPTACNWLRRLTNMGDLQRLSNAILSGANSQPATFALPQED